MKDWSRDIYNIAITEGIPPALANLLVAQFKHESKEYTSHVFRVDNNFNGYKYIGQQGATEGLLSPEGDHYAHYVAPMDSVKELTRYLKRKVVQQKFPPLNTITTPEQYAALLKKVGYYGAPMDVYLYKLKKYLKDYSAVTAISTGTILIGAALLWFFLRK